MLHLDPLAPRTPRLPYRRLGALTQLAASTALHVTFVVVSAVIGTTSAPGIDVRRAERITDQQRPDVRHFVFLAPTLPRPGRGGGGGGNQRPDPIRRAQGVGADTITLRVRKEPPPTIPVTTAATPAVEDVPPPDPGPSPGPRPEPMPVPLPVPTPPPDPAPVDAPDSTPAAGRPI